MPEPKSPLSADDVVKLFSKQAITVAVVKSDRKGVPLRDPATHRFVTEDQPLAAAHIVGIKELDGEVGITTLDGKKYVVSTR